jgi:hypothetical protein
MLESTLSLYILPYVPDRFNEPGNSDTPMWPSLLHRLHRTGRSPKLASPQDGGAVLAIWSTPDHGLETAQLFKWMPADTAYPAKRAHTAGAPHGPANRSSSGDEICNDYNKDTCTYPACRYTHACTICERPHPAKQCSQKPRHSTEPAHIPSAIGACKPSNRQRDSAPEAPEASTRVSVHTH